MRALVVVLASSLIASGCAVNSYKIPPDELARLARVPPEARGEHVRVIQELVASEVPAAPPVTRETEVVIAPQFDVAVGVHGPRAGFGGGLGRAVNGRFGGLGKDSKSAAVAFLFAAATAAVTAAVIEGSRFDGWARLHPMHPVHLIGRDGGYTKQAGDVVVVIPTVEETRVTPHAEAFQAVIWHCLVSHPRLQRNATKW